MDKNTRICILGGGAAGLAAAMYLQVKGYTNYEVYERESVPGGRDGLGPGYGKPAAVLDLDAENAYALREMEVFSRETHADGFGRRVFWNAGGRETKPLDSGAGLPLSSSLANLRVRNQLRRLSHLLKTKYAGFNCYGHVGIAHGEFFGLSKEMDNHLRRLRGKNRSLKDLALPLEQFLRINGVPEAVRLFRPLLLKNGVGYTDEIPAAYVFKRFDIELALAEAADDYAYWLADMPGIYEGVMRRLFRPVHLGTEAVRVERRDESACAAAKVQEEGAGEGDCTAAGKTEGEAAGKILVTLRDAKGERVEAFDKLLVTIPLPAFAGLADASAEEKDLFGRICQKKMVELSGRLPAGEMPAVRGVLLGNQTPERLGHAVAWRADGWLAGKPVEKTAGQGFDGESAVAAYALQNHEGSLEISLEDAKETMLEDLALCGLPLAEAAGREMDGCPFIRCADYADGWYDRLEALQGRRSTFYGGRIVGAGGIEDALASSRDLVGRFF